ncbi:hypothetical protein KSP40_PGU005775 [Platanthera guangdongensis]|uniref:Uncharacterized protein n=1 Tax=Platanthera guangdongensis TaxID=2320717 RepID=A0ABR2LMP1_9ASPA
MPEVPTLICIGFLNGNHFVRLVLGACSPIPHIFPSWSTYHEEVAKNWSVHYNERLQGPPPATGPSTLQTLDN